LAKEKGGSRWDSLPEPKKKIFFNRIREGTAPKNPEENALGGESIEPRTSKCQQRANVKKKRSFARHVPNLEIRRLTKRLKLGWPGSRIAKTGLGLRTCREGVSHRIGAEIGGEEREPFG